MHSGMLCIISSLKLTGHFPFNRSRHIQKERSKESQKLFTHSECLSLATDADPFFDVYFDAKSRDLGLLITLLACSNGIAEGLR